MSEPEMSEPVISQPVLRIDGLTKSFGGVTAVADLSLTVAAGERVGLIGPNGAGKTTLINLISGLLLPDRGQIYLANTDISRSSPQHRWRSGLGRTFQIASAYNQLDIGTNVGLAVAQYYRRATWSPLRGLPNSAFDQADDLLATVGLAVDPKTPVNTLAYGQVKRLELAIALANRPRLLLLDEPMAGVGREGDSNLVSLASDALFTDDNPLSAMLFTEHDMDVVFGQATRILVLDQGQLIADGPPDQIAADDRVRAVYLGEAIEP
ncbi:MAG: ABC transporter ATP-binding protein [Pseudomonadota bacterium]